METSMQPGTELLATFFVDDVLFGVNVHSVQEIIRLHGLTAVPLAPQEVAGLINLRGQIITAIDAHSRLGFQSITQAHERMNVVLQVESEVVSLIVDSVGDVIELASKDFEPTPTTVKESLRKITSGVYKLQDRLLLVVDAAKIVQI